MEKLLNPSFAFFLVVACVWVFRARLALTTVREIPAVRPLESSQPVSHPDLVSIVVPVKNEERNIRDCLESLLAQGYPHFEIVVVNDRSSDRTEAILQSFGSKIKYVNATPTPEGWTGKNFALATALPSTQGAWLLFTDADTRHEPVCLASVMAHARSRQLEFLTLLPRCLTENFFEHLIQPCAMAFLGLWFPMQKVNDPKSPVFFANGQYLLMRRKLYEKLGGHAGVRGQFLEDFALMKKAKESGARTECALGADVYGTRMYESLEALWRGWRRIYLHAFGHAPWPLFARSLSLIFFSVIPFASLIPLSLLAWTYPARFGAAWGAALPILFFVLMTCWKGYGIVKAKRAYALLHPVAAFFLAMILLDAAWMAVEKRPTTWR